MKDAIDHNRLMGPGLIVWSMDHLRAMRTAGTEVTIWSLNKALCEKHKLKGRDRIRQYDRIRIAVRQLEASGMLTTAHRWDGEQEKYHKVITLCSE